MLRVLVVIPFFLISCFFGDVVHLVWFDGGVEPCFVVTADLFEFSSALYFYANEFITDCS